MNYANIKYFDIADGEGVRTSLFVSGCRRGCKNCFNSVAWDFAAGEPFDRAVEDKIIESLDHPFIDGLTILGGPRIRRGSLSLSSVFARPIQWGRERPFGALLATYSRSLCRAVVIIPR